MTTSAIKVRFDSDSMWVELADGRTIGVPIIWFPRLVRATADERNGYTLSAHGIHWEDIDEDVSIEGLLEGKGDQSRAKDQAA